ncbi:MAG TPA: hypothetical protein VGP72_26970 [Planctomycetota bacterium]|jgi:hypothetical protein
MNSQNISQESPPSESTPPAEAPEWVPTNDPETVDQTVLADAAGSVSYGYHPIAEIFPLPDTQGANPLAKDIAANGLKNAIVMYKGKILDGRIREEACRIAGVKPRYVEFTGDDPVAWVISQNLHRRHLSESQRASVAARMVFLLQAEAKQRMMAGKADPSGNLREGGKCSEQAAELLNVSARSVESASQVLKEGSAELATAVAAGQIPVSTAATITALPKSDQLILVKQGAAAIKARAKEMRMHARNKRRSTPISRGSPTTAAQGSPAPVAQEAAVPAPPRPARYKVEQLHDGWRIWMLPHEQVDAVLRSILEQPLVGSIFQHAYIEFHEVENLEAPPKIEHARWFGVDEKWLSQAAMAFLRQTLAKEILPYRKQLESHCATVADFKKAMPKCFNYSGAACADYRFCWQRGEFVLEDPFPYLLRGAELRDLAKSIFDEQSVKPTDKNEGGAVCKEESN